MYLDENIIYTFSITPENTPSTKVYQVKKGTKILFVGNISLTGKESSVDIDVTDVLRSLKMKDKLMSTNPNPNNYPLVEFLQEEIAVVLVLNETNSLTQAKNIFFIYRYPRVIEGMNPTLQVMGAFTTDKLMLQGANYTNDALKLSLTPRYPFVATSKLGWGVAMQVSEQSDNILINYYGALAGTGDIVFSVEPQYTNIIYTTLQQLFRNAVIDTTKDKAYIGPTQNHIFAQIDMCPAQYYVQWIDRYGTYQCQPFSKISTFSNDYSTTHMISYDKVKKPIFKTVNSTWNLNSEFIPEDKLPYYESLFVSDKVILYDAKNDESYNVVLTDTKFVEKTFANQQRRLFNLQITVEKANEQYILS